jgi:hypothetical protein
MIGITMVCLQERGGSGIRIGPTVGCAGRQRQQRNYVKEVQRMERNSGLCLSYLLKDLCGLVVRVPGYRSRGPGSIAGAIRFSEQ